MLFVSARLILVFSFVLLFFPNCSKPDESSDGGAASEDAISSDQEKMLSTMSVLTVKCVEDEKCKVEISQTGLKLASSGQEVKLEVRSQPRFGMTEVTPNGDIYYTSTPNYQGADQFAVGVTLKGSDGKDVITSPASVFIEVKSVNDAPVAVDQNLGIDPSKPILISLMASDADEEQLKYEISSPPKNYEVVSLDETTGKLQLKIIDTSIVKDEFEFTVTDKENESAKAKVRLDIGTPNSPPTAQAIVLSTSEDIYLDAKLSGLDPDKNRLRFRVSRQPNHGTIQFKDPFQGTFLYFPNSDYNGPDSFEYTVEDGMVVSAPATATLTITPVNDKPKIVGLRTLTLAEDTPTQIEFAITDVDGDSVGMTYAFHALHGSLASTGIAPPGIARYTYTPEANYYGKDIFSIGASDGNGSFADKFDVGVDVTPVNDPPLAPNLQINTAEEMSINGQISATDVEGETLNYQMRSNPIKGNVSNFNSQNGSFIYAPFQNKSGSDTFLVDVSDGSQTTQVTVTINIGAVNDAPTASGSSLTVNEDGTLNGQMNASDVDGDPLIYQVTSQPTHKSLFTFNANTGALQYVPAANYFGSDAFSFKVNDQGNPPLYSAVVSVNINVVSVDDLPVITMSASEPFSVTEDTSFNFSALGLSVTDVDGPSCGGTYQILYGNPVHLSVSGNVITPELNYSGPAQFTATTYNSCYYYTQSTSRVINFTVSPVNDRPVANNMQVTGVNGSRVIQLNAIDVDGDSLTPIITVQPGKGTVTVNPGQPASVTYVPTSLVPSGIDTFSYKVSDGQLDSSSSAAVTVSFANNLAPVASNISKTVVEDSSSSTTNRVTFPSTDSDGDSIWYIVTVQPQHGTTFNSGGSLNLVYIPSSNYSGSDSLTYYLTDGVLNSAPATIDFTVTPVNDPPTAGALYPQVFEGASTNITIASSDVDGDTLSYAITTPPTKGTAVPSGNTIVYTPTVSNLVVVETDSMVVQVNDGNGGTASASVYISIYPINYGPGSAISVAAGGSHTCAVSVTGKISCWGYNYYRQAGSSPNTSYDTPQLKSVSGKSFVSVAAGNNHSCALSTDGLVYCWGQNSYGQIGSGGSSTYLESPTLVSLGTGLVAKAVVVGGDTSCALFTNNKMKCWGSSSYGQLGYGNTNPKGLSSSDMGNNLAFVDLGADVTGVQTIDVGDLHVCALTLDGRVKCWGYNGNGQLGLGVTNSTISSPQTSAVNLGSGFTAVSIAAGTNESCALSSNSNFKCWGYNAYGNLGSNQCCTNRGTSAAGMGDSLPFGSYEDALLTFDGVTKLGVGWYFGCALRGSSLHCWGYNGHGQLGRGNASTAYAPHSTKTAFANSVKSFDAGYYHVCAISLDNKVRCWGEGGGKLGISGSVSNIGDNPGEMGSIAPVPILQ